MSMSDEATGSLAGIVLVEQLQSLFQANRDLQNALMGELALLEHRIEVNKKRRIEMSTFTLEKMALLHVATLPVSKSNKPRTDESINPDAVVKRKLKKRIHYDEIYHPRSWTQRESESLADGVRIANERLLSIASVNKYKNVIRDEKTTESEKERLMQELQEKLHSIKMLPRSQLEMNLDGLDWERISRIHVRSRSPEECCHQWINVQHPLINWHKWTADEDNTLLELVEKHHQRHWEKICEEFNGGFTQPLYRRTPSQCFTRYFQRHPDHIKRGPWSPEEDTKLREAVAYHGERHWATIARSIAGRTAVQCMNRWHKVINPDIIRGRWSNEEDVALVEAVLRFGRGSWSLIRDHVQGRTDVQCRERWTNVLDPRVKRDNWTTVEDQRLLKAVQTHGVGRWADIAKDVGVRTDSQCNRRYYRLLNFKKHGKPCVLNMNSSSPVEQEKPPEATPPSPS